MELGCKWHFGNEGGIDVGPNDPIHQTFKGNPFYSIVREAIQNSLDAINDDRFPVKVEFKYFELDRSEYPLFFQLEDHIIQAADYYINNVDAERLFGDMRKYLSGNKKLRKKQKVSCLRISDSNTKGMNFNQGTDSSFYAFLRAAGVSSKKSSGSGGSFGFGKGAYFALSPIKTLIVSSKDPDGKVLFEGATRLTTHKNELNKKLTAYGFYDNNNGNPVTKEESIPQTFLREEAGTDVNIIGLWEEVDRETLMIKSVLNNFWLAIHAQKLVVSINKLTISKENLEQIIDEYFATEFESGQATEIEAWNPKPYYKAVKYADANEQFRIFSDDLPVLGKVKLNVYLERGLPNRVAYFRKPKMVVFKRTNRKINGYAAVFMCESTVGNKILRMMENPAHNEWKKEYYPHQQGKIDPIARKAEKEFNDYVNEKLDSLAKLNTSKKVAFLGLEEYLSIPEDLLEKNDESTNNGNNTSISGHSSKDLTDLETGLQTTWNNEPVLIKPTISIKGEAKNEENRESNEDKSENIFNDSAKTGGKTEKNVDGKVKIDTGNDARDESFKRRLVKVGLRVAAQKDKGIMFHNLLITSESEVMNVELELLVSSDNDRDDGISIVSSDIGRVMGNKLKELTLLSGVNHIKVRFADSMKHTVKIRAYEIQ